MNNGWRRGEDDFIQNLGRRYPPPPPLPPRSFTSTVVVLLQIDVTTKLQHASKLVRGIFPPSFSFDKKSSSSVAAIYTICKASYAKSPVVCIPLLTESGIYVCAASSPLLGWHFALEGGEGSRRRSPQARLLFTRERGGGGEGGEGRREIEGSFRQESVPAAVLELNSTAKNEEGERGGERSIENSLCFLPTPRPPFPCVDCVRPSQRLQLLYTASVVGAVVVLFRKQGKKK